MELKNSNRDFFEVIQELLNLCNIDEPWAYDLHAALGRIRADAMYTAPERMPARWGAVAALLFAAFPIPKDLHINAQKMLEVFTTKPIATIIAEYEEYASTKEEPDEDCEITLEIERTKLHWTRSETIEMLDNLYALVDLQLVKMTADRRYELRTIREARNVVLGTIKTFRGTL